MTPNEALEIVKAKIATGEIKQETLAEAWNKVCDAIENRALTAKVKPKVFEVRHETVTARAAFMMHIAKGGDIGVATVEAKISVGL